MTENKNIYKDDALILATSINSPT